MKSIKIVYTLLLIWFFGINLQGQVDYYSLPVKLSKEVNSKSEESFPIPAGEVLYFTRTFHPQNKGGETAGQDIWYSKKADSTWLEAKNNISEINNRNSNALVGISVDGNKIYLLNKYLPKTKTNKGLSFATKTTDGWSEAQIMVFPDLKFNGDFYSAYVSPDESFVLISMPGKESMGKNDLYVLNKDNNGNWQEPQNLGAAINTIFDEISPYFNVEENRLYFSSLGHSGHGGYDIFYAERKNNSWTEWEKPVNMGLGINSAHFDAYFIRSGAEDAYFASNRGDTLSDIYFATRIDKPNIKESDTLPSLAEEVIIESLKESEKIVYEPELLIETKDGIQKIALDKMSREELTDEETNIRFIYFEYNKANISSSYQKFLDQIVGIMKNNPDFKLKLEGHADDFGSEAYNFILSENRAYEAEQYLISRGIDARRIKTEGLGEKIPFASNETEEGRGKNRRVEIFFSE